LGEDISHDAPQLEKTRDLSTQEQATIAGAEQHTLLRLRAANRAYRERFGFIFIACATGKTADEVLELLTTRLDHEPARELSVAAAEQAKITRLRLLGLSA
jgi:OHCU decarboxylase